MPCCRQGRATVVRGEDRVVTAEMVRELRERTGAGMMDCKKALVETDGDMERAVEYLRRRGLAQAAKKAGRSTTEGLVEAYVHGGGRIGVLVEVNCETDFVARNDIFKAFVHDVALQVAAARPMYLRREDVPPEVLEKERSIYREQALNEGKPERIVEKMVEGRLDKFFKENCLLEQTFIRDPEKTIADLQTEIIARMGENVSIRRFSRFELGEGLTKEQTDFAAEVERQAGR